MATFRIEGGFEHQSNQVSFTLVMHDDGERVIARQRVTVPSNANPAAIDALIQKAVNDFPSTAVEDLIRDSVAGLNP